MVLSGLKLYQQNKRMRTIKQIMLLERCGKWPSIYQGRHRVTLTWLKNATVFAAVLGAAGGLSHVLTLLLGVVNPQSSSPLGWERVESSKLCIDKGRHRSAFHHSVNDAHKKRKKKHCKFLKTKKRECLKHLHMKYLVTLISVSVCMSV